MNSKFKKIISIMIITILITVGLSIPANAASYDPGFETTSKAITLLNLDTGITVYEKNSNEKVYPASVTKIMTYIVTIENVVDVDNTMVTVSKELIDSLEGTQSSLADLKEGETLSVYTLLNCLMVPSGNDAATVLAHYVGNGDIQVFVDMMNQKAQELGCTNTHFVNPTGLHDENHYTTSNDVCKFTQYAMQMPMFMNIVSQTSYTVPQTNLRNERQLVSTNYMMIPYYEEYYYKYTSGIKTGWHDQAGYCIVTSATADGYSYICAAMGAPSQDENGEEIETNAAMLDSRELYRWALTTFEIKNILDSNSPIDEIPINYAWGQDTVLLSPEKSVSYLLPKDVNPSSISVTMIDRPDSVDAPIKKGDIVGRAKLSYANQDLMEINVVADGDVSRSDLMYYLHVLKNIFSSFWFILMFVVFIILVIVYILLMRAYNKKSNKRVRKYRNF